MKRVPIRLKLTAWYVAILLASLSLFGIAAFGVCIDIGGNHAGAVSGLMNCIGQMGAFFLAIVFGKIVDTTHSFNTPLFLISCLMLIGCSLWLLVDPTKKLILEIKDIQIKQAALY